MKKGSLEAAFRETVSPHRQQQQTSWSEVLARLIIIQMSRHSSPFLEQFYGSLPCSQKPDSGTKSEPDELCEISGSHGGEYED
jgi:hypothetical protein